MSRKRRNRGDAPPDLLSELQSNDLQEPIQNITASGIADAAYGSSIGHDDPFAQLGRSREKILRKPIVEIFPNPTQPRRAIPSPIRHYFTQPDADSMARAFELWLREVEVERGSQFPLDALLAGEPTDRSAGIDRADEELSQIQTASHGPLEVALTAVVDLAASIQRDGLTNPITIAEAGDSYEIETGERRWLAFHLLNWRAGGADEEWEKIPVRIVDDVNIWRQADENNQRADLNAISRARQFALLLMDVLAERGEDFAKIDSFDQEQDYYAQVADGTVYRVPRNRGEALLNAMNLENPVQLRQYRALLRLPKSVWEWADDLNWTESFIRKDLLAKSDTDEELTRLAYKQAKLERHPVTGDTVYEELIDASQPKPSKRAFSYTDFADTLGVKVYKYLNQLDGTDRERTISYLREMLETLEAE